MKTLLVTDRVSGDETEVPETSPAYRQNVYAAVHIGISFREAQEILDDGGELETCSFFRRHKQREHCPAL